MEQNDRHCQETKYLGHWTNIHQPTWLVTNCRYLERGLLKLSDYHRNVSIRNIIT